MIYFQQGELIIRSLAAGDVFPLAVSFKLQGWDKPAALFEKYLAQQEEEIRQVFLAEFQGEAAGYATLRPCAKAGPFAGMNIPEITDFNVLIKFQRQGIGSRILNMAEKAAARMCDTVCLGAGLHAGYGAAQRLYVKRGYIPDGSGVWYRDEKLAAYAPCANDDDLVLYFSKKLK